jgi:hypothetical protein
LKKKKEVTFFNVKRLQRSNAQWQTFPDGRNLDELTSYALIRQIFPREASPGTKIPLNLSSLGLDSQPKFPGSSKRLNLVKA